MRSRDFHIYSKNLNLTHSICIIPILIALNFYNIFAVRKYFQLPYNNRIFQHLMDKSFCKNIAICK